ncbi:MAG: RAD55 family ATPase [Thermoplasmata archaeon]
MTRARLSTHVKGLDETLQGGIPEGHIVLVTGAPGTMKSSLGFSVLYHNALTNGTKGLYLTLEQSKVSLIAHVESMGMADAKAYKKISLFDMAALRKNLSFIKAEGSWNTLLKAYLTNLMETDPYQFLVIDSLNVLETLANFDARRTDLFYLFEWLKDLGATTFILSESGDRPSSRDADEAYLADGLIHLSLYSVSDLDVQRRIRCVKMRATEHDMGSFALVWNGRKFEITRAVSVGRPTTVEAV